MRPELLVELEVATLAEEIQVLLAENRGEPVRVLDLSFSVLLPRYPEPVGHPLPDGDGTGEESGRVYGFQLAQSIAAVGDDLHGARAGQEGPYHEAAIPCGVHPEEGERVGKVAGHDGSDSVFVPQDPSSPTVAPRRSRMPPMGMPTQFGRLSSS